MEPLPPELLQADERLHRLHVRLRFSRHLNPENVPEARTAFLRGAEAPPFRYAPADWAEDALAELDAVRAPLAHPLGVELARAARETRAWVVALRDRTADAFAELARVCAWTPYAGDLDTVDEDSPARAQLPVEDVVAALRGALRARGLVQWTLELDPVMSARVLVDSARREVRVSPHARFRAGDAEALVAHEIDVHVLRCEAGRLQPLRLFSTGLPGALTTEEGLALHAEARVAGLAPGFLRRQARLAHAVRDAEVMGFRDLFESLSPDVGSATAFGMALRLKRGLAHPERGGVYAKDCVYLAGWRAVGDWLAGGGDVARLYVGKVGLDHPVADWIAAGWVIPGPVAPTMFRSPR